MTIRRRGGGKREGLISLLNKNFAGYPLRMKWAGAYFALLMIMVPAQSFAQGVPLAVKFYFTFDRFYEDTFNTPAGIFVDTKNHEIYLADSGKKELYLFDTSGSPLFRIGKASGISSPLDIVVRSNLIYLSQEGKDYIDVLGYRGDNIGRIRPYHDSFSPGRMTVDSTGNIYVINKSRTNCAVIDKNNKLIRTIGEGLLSITDVAAGMGRVYLITPSDSRAVQVFDQDGKYIMGFEGLDGRGGTLGLPISAKIDRLGFLWLLDALKGIVVYNEKGVEVNRFHVSGRKEGELNFPVEIDIDDEDRLYIVDKGAKRVTVFKVER